ILAFAVDGVHWAAVKAVRLVAGAATGGDEEAVEARPFAKQSAGVLLPDFLAVAGGVRVSTGAGAFVAARAAVKVEDEEFLALIEAEANVLSLMGAADSIERAQASHRHLLGP